MIIDSAAQIHAFFLCISLGLGLGLLYDLLRVLRLSLRPLQAVTDLFFWLCFLFTLFFCAGMLGDGRVRLYMALSLMGGISLYFLLPSPFVRRFLDFQRRKLTAQLENFSSFLKKILKKTFSFFL